MKRILIPVLLVFFTLGLNAESRTADQALAIARSFVQSTPHLSSLKTAQFSLAPMAAVPAGMHRVKSQIEPAYYIFNVGEKACVIVSGDDRFADVLGYTTNGTVNKNAPLPDGMGYWLDFLEREMAAAKAAGYDRNNVTSITPSFNAAASVEPLLTTTWSQDAPFNDMLSGNMTGCVATGTAQVMRFWKYPERGVGNHQGAYSPNFSADFGTTTYDWNNMLDAYGTGWESRQEVNAVATLMMHLGVATDMRWSKTSSATSSPFAAYALTTYFKYNPKMYIESRDHMSLGAWKSLLINQLQSGRPLCYWGTSVDAGGSAGHFFVCDGYDANTGYFHFNWGWGGYCDGYYAVTALEPGTGGIGAGAGTYNTDQCIIVNLQPDVCGEYVTHFDAQRIDISGSTTNNVKITTTSLSNNNTYNVEGSLGLAVYKQDGSVLRYAASDFTLPYAGYSIGSVFSGEVSYYVNLNGIADGTYTVCAAAYSKREEAVFPVRAQYANNTYYKMVVSGNSVSFTAANNLAEVSSTKLELASNVSDVIYQNVFTKFNVTVRNSSAIDFNDEIGISFEQNRSKKGTIAVPAYIAAGETKTIEVCGQIPSSVNLGSATAKAVYGIDGTYNPLGASLTLQVQQVPTGINDVLDNQGNAQSYNLQGKQVNAGYRGIVIKNGKKFIKK